MRIPCILTNRLSWVRYDVPAASWHTFWKCSNKRKQCSAGCLYESLLRPDFHTDHRSFEAQVIPVSIRNDAVVGHEESDRVSDGYPLSHPVLWTMRFRDVMNVRQLRRPQTHECRNLQESFVQNPAHDVLVKAYELYKWCSFWCLCCLILQNMLTLDACRSTFRIRMTLPCCKQEENKWRLVQEQPAHSRLTLLSATTRLLLVVRNVIQSWRDPVNVVAVKDAFLWTGKWYLSVPSTVHFGSRSGEFFIR